MTWTLLSKARTCRLRCIALPPVGPWAGSATTEADGSVAFKLRNAQDGCYSTDVDSITAAGLTFDGNTGPFPDATCRSGSSNAKSRALQAD